MLCSAGGLTAPRALCPRTLKCRPRVVSHVSVVSDYIYIYKYIKKKEKYAEYSLFNFMLQVTLRCSLLGEWVTWSLGLLKSVREYSGIIFICKLCHVQKTIIRLGLYKFAFGKNK